MIFEEKNCYSIISERLFLSSFCRSKKKYRWLKNLVANWLQILFFDVLDYLMKEPFSKQPTQELHAMDKELKEDVLGWEGEGPGYVLGVVPTTWHC